MTTIKPINSNPTKEFHRLLKFIGQKTNNQAALKSYNLDDISSFVIEICPKDGLYKNGKFLFQFQLCGYPREHPNVICLTEIYHPNIEIADEYHNVCLNIFDNWNKSFNLLDIIQGLIFLLYQPNLNDPISRGFNCDTISEELFKKNVYNSLHGGFVEGYEFLPNYGIVEYESKLAEDKTNSTKPSDCQTKEESVESKDKSEAENVNLEPLLNDNKNNNNMDVNVIEDNIDASEGSEDNDVDCVSTIDEELAKLNSNNTNVYSNNPKEIIMDSQNTVEETMENNNATSPELTTNADPKPPSSPIGDNLQKKGGDECDHNSDKASTIYDEGVYAENNTEIDPDYVGDNGGYIDAVWSRFVNRGEVDSSSDDSESQEEHNLAQLQMGQYYFAYESECDDLGYDDLAYGITETSGDEDDDNDDGYGYGEFQLFHSPRNSSFYERDKFIVLPDIKPRLQNLGSSGMNSEIVLYEFMKAWIYYRRVTKTYNEAPRLYTWIVYDDEYRPNCCDHQLFMNTDFGEIVSVKNTCKYTHLLIWFMNITKYTLINTLHPVSSISSLYTTNLCNFSLNSVIKRPKFSSVTKWLLRSFINELQPSKTVTKFTTSTFLIYYILKFAVVHLCTYHLSADDQNLTCLFLSRKAHIYRDRSNRS